MAKMEEDIRKN